MPRVHRLCSPLLTFFSLSCWVSQCQTQPEVIPVPWDVLRTAAQDLRQNLASGNAGPAHLRVIQMQLLLAGSSRGLKIGDQIAIMERRPIPDDNYPFLSRYVPLADNLLQAIGEGNASAANSYLGELNSDLGAVRTMRARSVRATLPQATKDTAILDLQHDLEDALQANHVERAVLFATQMQGMISDLVSKHEFVNEFAFNHYMVNDALGRAAFLKGDFHSASEYLQKAADVPLGANGTVRLDSFGPNLWLAEQLLRVGRGDVVLKFLETCKERFWHHDNDKADPWIAAIQSGKPSGLSPNSSADYGYLAK